ncbi:type II toxin-antitoxin system VapC family toxin [Algiphilus sp.]|uniref:type II toxin-antitoxin system VapC family toxin n=1 Tax=Algiphilus sp. TaxID=1872431 RepID=UPI003BABC141
MVDSSVWIDSFNGVETQEVAVLCDSLGQQAVAIGDLMLAEVLQGFRKDKDFRAALELFESIPVLELAGKTIAMQSARNFRVLRRKGVTVRKTIDCAIDTYRIEHQLPLLQSDRDFAPFRMYLGLKSAMDGDS